MTDDWKASVDAQLKQLRDDVQQVRNWIVVGIAGPLLAVMGLYVSTGSQANALEGRVTAVQVEQAKASGRLVTMEARLTERLTAIDAKVSRR